MASQVKTSSSLWHFYQKLIQIKKSPMHEALTFGKIDFLEDKDEDIFDSYNPFHTQSKKKKKKK